MAAQKVVGKIIHALMYVQRIQMFDALDHLLDLA